MDSLLMTLKVLLPFQIFSETKGVKRMVVETHQGSFGILPNRLDFVAALTPGILTYETQEEGEVYIAIDQGVIIKAGMTIRISVRNAIGGMSLGKLHEAVEREFINIDEREKNVRTVLARLESGFIQQFRKLQNE